MVKFLRGTFLCLLDCTTFAALVPHKIFTGKLSLMAIDCKNSKNFLLKIFTHTVVHFVLGQLILVIKICRNFHLLLDNLNLL